MVNELITKYQKLIDTMIPESENICVKLVYEDNDILSAKFFMRREIPGMPQIPGDLREALKDIDQHVTAKLVLGVDADKLLNENYEKPLIE